MERLRPEWEPKECLFKRKYLYTIREDGKKNIDFRNYLVDNWEGKQYLELPCRKCLYCQQHYSILWATRCVLEAEETPNNNCFITLTYDNEHLPKDGFLDKKDYQKFIRSIRKKYKNQKIRFFMSGEYTRDNYRPHFHILFFNYKPQDLVPWQDGLYLSEEVRKIWGKGFISVGIDISIKTVKYIAKYMSKLVLLPIKYNDRPEFIQASTKPGIAYNQYDIKHFKNKGIYVGGAKQTIPEYYFKLAERFGHAEELEEYKKYQIERCIKNKKPEWELDKQTYNYVTTCVEKNIGYSHLYDLRRLDLKEEYKKIQNFIREASKDSKIKN